MKEPFYGFEATVYVGLLISKHNTNTCQKLSKEYGWSYSLYQYNEMSSEVSDIIICFSKQHRILDTLQSQIKIICDSITKAMPDAKITRRKIYTILEDQEL